MTNRELEDLIKNYIFTNNKVSRRNSLKSIRMHSLINWAAKELLAEVRESNKEPEQVVEDFIRDMDIRSTYSLVTSEIFSTAKTVGEDIMDSIIFYKERSSK